MVIGCVRLTDVSDEALSIRYDNYTYFTDFAKKLWEGFLYGAYIPAEIL